VFEGDLERDLLLLCADLNTGWYRHNGYSHRIVNEKKRRDIAVASVRDRVVHRLLYDYLVPLVDPKLDYDVWSCRAGKGLHQALLRAKDLMTKYDHAWVWRADISKFFDNVDQASLKIILSRHIRDEKALELLGKVIDSYTIISSQSVSQSVRYTDWQSDEPNLRQHLPQ
jgi:retron-type reverse transcriptase